MIFRMAVLFFLHVHVHEHGYARTMYIILATKVCIYNTGGYECTEQNSIIATDLRFYSNVRKKNTTIN